ncbi:helix-turn-helix domain-containing protein [Devriesea agamarum]|uniref:helix-turn-helix domain-containing protein n=1 Tax=Devriesea agamarum TaxID=472569 RepID=UPI00071E158A|nr:helix-turn-helix domain-containing protein [Devriesea agamarum]
MTESNFPHGLLSTTQVAERLGITRNTVLQRLATDRLVPAMKLPGRTGAYLFDPAVIESIACEDAAHESEEN